MFQLHCECCGSSQLACYYLRPANGMNCSTEEIYNETEAKIREDGGTLERLARKQTFAAFGGKLPFFCLDCGFLSVNPLQPMTYKEDADRLGKLRPQLTVVN